MTYTFRKWHIPEHMMGAIERYVEHGFGPGHFLTAVIHNNLKEACARADDENIENLPAYVAYFYNELPAACWGSPETMCAWIEKVRNAKPKGGEE